MTGSVWIDQDSGADIKLMAETLGISEITAAVLANRAVRSKNAAIKFLNPAKKFMYDAALLGDIGKAAALTAEALRNGDKIAVYGDYDADGILSTVILYKTLRILGDSCGDSNVLYYIPHRETEGYGLNLGAVEKLHADGVKLLITCDNGIAAENEIRAAKDFGMKVVVIDHHEPNAAFRSDMADAVIDPKVPDCPYPFKRLCAAALCYKFAAFLFRFMEMPINSGLEEEFLIFAAIASVCDIVSLTDENRIITAQGLSLLNALNVKNLGLKALIKLRGLEGKKIGGFEIGFVLGPCINATGRLERADIAVELFLAESEEAAIPLAQRLVELNEERKRLTAESVKTVLAGFSGSGFEDNPIYVIYCENLHESIAGIVAGRVKEVTGRPTIILTKGGGEGMAKGSARSIPGYNIFGALDANRELFERFGGHEMAAGLTIKEENIDLLRERLISGCNLTDTDFSRKIFIDGKIKLTDISFALAAELKLLAPFGRDNGEPVFRTVAAVDNVEAIGTDKKTLRFSIALGGQKLKGICFSMFGEFSELLENIYGSDVYDYFRGNYRLPKPIEINLAFCVEINEFNGTSQLQLRILDFKPV